MTARTCAVLLVFALACGAVDESPPVPAASPPAESPPPATPELPTVIDPCTQIREQAADLIAAEQQQCTSDDECGCAPAIIDCGGVFEQHTASALQALKARWSAEHCEYRRVGGDRFNCGPWQCIAVCTNGRCSRGSR